jgi:hypothetical protein
VNGAAVGKLLEGLLLDANAIVHGEELGDIVIVDDEHEAISL